MLELLCLTEWIYSKRGGDDGRLMENGLLSTAAERCVTSGGVQPGCTEVRVNESVLLIPEGPPVDAAANTAVKNRLQTARQLEGTLQRVYRGTDGWKY